MSDKNRAILVILTVIMGYAVIHFVDNGWPIPYQHQVQGKPDHASSISSRIDRQTSDRTGTDRTELHGVGQAKSAPSAYEPADRDVESRQLREAREELERNRQFEEDAMASLPLLSIQTHNPVWGLEYGAHQAGTRTQAGSGLNNSSSTTKRPLPAPVSGPFGKVQPHRGEIWIRIRPEYARQYRDIMAQDADMYRSETGYEGPVTIVLFVGGRPFARTEYE